MHNRISSLLFTAVGLTIIPIAFNSSELWNKSETVEPAITAKAEACIAFLSVLGFAGFLPIAIDNANASTVTGRYSYIGNPCTTEPCLPGMAYAVLANDKYYYITVDDRWFSDNRSWDGYTPEPGDLVTITGYLQQKSDIFGKVFYTLEAVSLQLKKSDNP